MEEYTHQNIKQLKEELKKRGLPLSGKKQDLIDRLEKNDLELEEQNGILSIYVKTMIGSCYTIKIDKNKTVYNFKEAIAERLGHDPTKMRLYYITFGVQPQLGDLIYPDSSVGIRLDDNLSLDEQGVTNERFFELRISLL